MTVMARLDYKYKLSARTDPGLNRKVRDLVGVLQDQGFTFQSGEGTKRMKVGIEGLVGAVILEFLDRTREAQIDVVRRRLPEYEAILTGGTRPVDVVKILDGPVKVAADDKMTEVKSRPVKPRVPKKGRA